jgi:hypothetical protein
MSQILHIIASPNGTDSHSLLLSDVLIEKLGGGLLSSGTKCAEKANAIRNSTLPAKYELEKMTLVNAKYYVMQIIILPLSTHFNLLFYYTLFSEFYDNTYRGTQLPLQVFVMILLKSNI